MDVSHYSSGCCTLANIIIVSHTDPTNTQSYASLLGFVNLFSKTTGRPNTRFHVTTLLLVVSAVYVYRDVWTFATYQYRPKDPNGPLLWVQVISAVVGGVAIPLVEASATPVLAEEAPITEEKQATSPEQTSSWLSWVTFFYLDPFINLTNRRPRVGPDDFIALPNTEVVPWLVRDSFPVIDPFSGAPERHIGISLIILYRAQFILCALLILVKVASNFTVPFAINRILRHLETDGAEAVVRPWVWVVLLFVGPSIGVLAYQVYAHVNVVNAVRAEAVLTRLIFDHALRMRAKADIEDNSNGKSTNKGNFAGKLNNLIASDLWNIADGREFLALCK
jgi:hypothetical protein